MPLTIKFYACTMHKCWYAKYHITAIVSVIEKTINTATINTYKTYQNCCKKQRLPFPLAIIRQQINTKP